MTRETKGNYFAIRPLATELISLYKVPVRAYQSGKGLDAPVLISFKSIDLEVWARQFLQAMDDFLFSLPRDYRDEWLHDQCALYDVAAPREKRTGGLWPDFKRVADACADVARAVAEGADYLIQETNDPQELERVRKGVRRALLRGLSVGYATDSVFESRAVLLYTHGAPALTVRLAPSDTPQEGIPVALRAYPAPPVLTAQSGVVAHPGASNIDQARLWNYVFDLEHRSEDQDSLYVVIVINPPEESASMPHTAPRLSTQRVERPLTLANALAAFISAYPAIRPDLPVPLRPDGQDTAISSPAVKALAELAEAVAAGWRTFWQDSGQYVAGATNDTVAKDESTFRLEKRYKLCEGLRVLDAITLSLAGDAAISPKRWPSLSLEAPDGEYYALTREPAGDKSSIYVCKGLPFESDGSHIRFGLEELDVLRVWRIMASASAARNEILGGIPAMNEAFVYRTPMVTFYNPIMPMVLQSESIAMEQQTADLAASLSGFLSKLIGEEAANHSIQISVTYRRGLKQDALKGEGGFLGDVLLPVHLVPPVPYDKKLGNNLAEAVQKWWVQNAPGEPGHFELGVAVSPEGSRIPVLRLERVVFSL